MLLVHLLHEVKLQCDNIVRESVQRGVPRGVSRGHVKGVGQGCVSRERVKGASHEGMSRGCVMDGACYGSV